MVPFPAAAGYIGIIPLFRYKMKKIFTGTIDKPVKAVIMYVTIEHLIKSGGGNGPVKPGNLRLQGAKSGGETKDEAFAAHFGAPSDDGVFVCRFSPIKKEKQKI